ncbi:TetR/AcrR family transcriptional regulator [Thauera linaloolentis]|uniref:TetR family transcriptional regulator n=1 Tax=Thauera linaloolentis (strain DSM 12138 / JCM 21573 / CCUG 41526 / CIP 105981 / IAM 15112 / NBRC 102519 / 47Lol) TaxID=1123367 RepID=N6YYQ4_THAL4|nr:TetR/AcrR family transcriptional regulator [Thauera linaloolentis]ENO87273.1 TetR family transcriptional regulator [Thauera linaloolentis 47Lol = DSM 12138]MCM8566723.1 TetR/AcrR family transcriptional regulator [Thauera linaloolentis]
MSEENAVESPLTSPAQPVRRIARARRESARASGTTWQAEKSQATRNQILDATLQCLVELGYTQTTTEKIAQRAGVSRGAMTHHFKSRADVFNAAAEFITDLRAVEYEDAVRRVKLPPGNTPTFESMLETLEVLQKYYYGRPSFIALQELQRGARTDKDLQSVLQPLEEVLDQRKSASLLKRFPYWADYPETSQVLRDLFFHSLKGVAINPTPYMKDDRLKKLHHLLATVAMMEMEKAYQATHDGQSPPRDEPAAPAKKTRKAGKAAG